MRPSIFTPYVFFFDICAEFEMCWKNNVFLKNKPKFSFWLVSLFVRDPLTNVFSFHTYRQTQKLTQVKLKNYLLGVSVLVQPREVICSTSDFLMVLQYYVRSTNMEEKGRTLVRIVLIPHLQFWQAQHAVKHRSEKNVRIDLGNSSWWYAISFDFNNLFPYLRKTRLSQSSKLWTSNKWLFKGF